MEAGMPTTGIAVAPTSEPAQAAAPDADKAPIVARVLPLIVALPTSDVLDGLFKAACVSLLTIPL